MFFNIHKENAQLIITIFGIKIKLKDLTVNQLSDSCCIRNLDKLKKDNIKFPHPIGIVISKHAKIGKNCTIYQNVTIGEGKFNSKINSNTPIIGENTIIYANSIVFGGITIGKNVKIGAGSIVFKDVEDNTIVAGNPARVIEQNK